MTAMEAMSLQEKPLMPREEGAGLGRGSLATIFNSTASLGFNCKFTRTWPGATFFFFFFQLAAACAQLRSWRGVAEDERDHGRRA